MLPIPPSSEGKRQLFEQLKAQAPDLLADINTLREQFPNAKVVYLMLPDGNEFGGQPAPDKVFVIGPEFKDPEETKKQMAEIERLEAERKSTLARQRRKTSRRAK